MDNEEIKNSGCDRYTKPEEIKALSKYLKAVKKIYDDTTQLETDTLGVQGFSDKSTIDVIDSLSSKVDSVLGNTNNKVVGLTESIEKVIKESGTLTGDLVKELSEKKDTILPSTKDEVSALNQEVPKLDPSTNSNSEPGKLSEFTDKLLKGSELTNSLSDKKENLNPDSGTGQNVVDLSDKLDKLDLQDSANSIKLSETTSKLNLGTRLDDISLKSEKHEVIGDSTETKELSKEVTKLNKGTERQTALSDVIDKIFEDHKPSLELGTVAPGKVQPSHQEGPSELGKYKSPVITKPNDVPLSTDTERVLGGNNREPSQLSDYLDNLFSGDSKTTKLESTKEKLVTSRTKETTLEIKKENLGSGLNKETEDLSNKREVLGRVEDVKSLSKTLDRLGNVLENSKLSSTLEVLNIPKSKVVLETKVEKKEGKDPKLNLENSIEKFPNTPKEVSSLNKVKEKRNSDKADELKGNKEFNPNTDILYDSVLQRAPDNTETGEPGTHKEFSGDSLKVHKEVVGHNDNLGSKNLSKLSTGKPEKRVESGQSGNTESLSDEKVSKEGDKNVTSLSSDKLEGDLIKDIIKPRYKNDIDAYYSNILHFADNKNIKSGWSQKIQSLMSAFLSKDPSKEDAERFQQMLYKAVLDEGLITEISKNTGGSVDNLNQNSPESIAKMSLPGAAGHGIWNAKDYIRHLAESIVSKSGVKDSKLRALLLDETLALLVLAREKVEDSTGSSKGRLAGLDQPLDTPADWKNVAHNAAMNVLSNSPNMNSPQNRPGSGKGYVTDGFAPLNSIGLDRVQGINSNVNDRAGSKGFWAKVSKVASQIGSALLGYNGAHHTYNFKGAYLTNALGMKTTLEDLAGLEPRYIRGVEHLRDLMRGASNITTAENFTSTSAGSMISTLDSNAYWEVTLVPYCEVGAHGNGGFSFLPPIEEINTWNKLYHGYDTRYSTYIPIVSFELQKSKMTSKTLSLYDGEISYPISMEFTNELRISIADDQFKSWRNYFERCSEVSIYSSLPHKASDYDGSYKDLTVVDKNYLCIAPYKNITFRCRIYCMTPQYSTINKYDLLLVMKDFSEDRSGDSDAGSGDLSISFSIVGENPISDKTGADSKIAFGQVPGAIGEDTSRRNKKAERAASIISSGVSSGMKLL